MSNVFQVQPLTPERIPEAFPLVASLDEDITAERWSAYARSFVRPPGGDISCGIMTLEDRQRHIIGLSAYHTRPDLQRGHLLVIENFAVVSLIKAQQGALMLLSAMEDLARDLGCPCLAVSLLDRKIRRSPNRHGTRDGRFFAGAGFRLDLARLGKCFDPTMAAATHFDNPAGSAGAGQA